METAGVVTFLQESLFLILTLVIFLMYAMIRSTQSLVNLILGLYFALLISLEFPYYNSILSSTGSSAKTESVIMILVFVVFTVLSTLLFAHLMPTDSTQPPFENFGKKFLFALAGTVLVMAYSYHVLPVTEVITPGSPIQYLFGLEQSFFWWLLVPLIPLFFL